jgi:hypothetical protein
MSVSFILYFIFLVLVAAGAFYARKVAINLGRIASALEDKPKQERPDSGSPN